MSMFGERLYYLRTKNNLSQINLSVKLGVTQESVSSYERGASLPSIDVLIRVHELFHVSTDYLLGITDIENTIAQDQLDSFESYLVSNYRLLPKKEKELLIKISDTICSTNELNNNAN